MDQQTKLEQERYTLCAAYQLARDDLRKDIVAGSDFTGALSAAVSVMNHKLETLVRAPNEKP